MSSAKILPTETQIVGKWIVEQGQTKSNAEARRIEELVDGYLQDVSVSDDGWSRLLRDPNDGRLWELTYPESSSHGGGAPSLRHVSRDDAIKRYKI